jgi:hypothetical protein
LTIAPEEGRLKTVRGQVDAVVRMVEEDPCCIDVARQVLAALILAPANTRAQVGLYRGGCNPVPITAEFVVIAKSILEQAKPLFLNWKKR